MANQANILEMQAVSLVYGEGRAAVTAVDQASLTVVSGEIVLIMGPSGSGKTTLLSMAGGLIRPSSGDVLISGRRLTELGPGALADLRLRQVGFVFQAFNLLASLTAIENVALVMNLAGRKDRSVDSAAKTLLDRLGLGERLTHVPAALSGGEKQRVAIARALANDPPLILADEPTGNLDSVAGRDVMMLLFDLAREEGKAVVVVSHDPRILDIADRVYWLQDGRLAEQRPEMEEKVQDPVCGMRLPLKDMPFSAVYQGRVFHFDREKCRRQFLEDPQKYLGTPS